MVGKGPQWWWWGGWVWVFMQAMCWGSGPGGPCAKGSDGLRKGSLNTRWGLEWWDTLPEGLRIFEIRTLHT